MSRIDYTRAFAKNVKGELGARFRLDPDGNPLYEDDDDGLRHYTIDLSLVSPMAQEIDSVTYFMDDETYWDPEAVSNDRDNDFTEEISSYGDFEVEVTVQIGKNAYKQRAWLSTLLEAGHKADSSPAIRNAINRLKAN